jgi:hypothetical protein
MYGFFMRGKPPQTPPGKEGKEKTKLKNNSDMF